MNDDKSFEAVKSLFFENHDLHNGYKEDIIRIAQKASNFA